MTPYQRGGRDALLALASELDATADAELTKYPTPPKTASARHAAVATQRQHQAVGLHRAATIARLRAEALPHDPEDGNTELF
jgi:hypothetical protein